MMIKPVALCILSVALSSATLPTGVKWMDARQFGIQGRGFNESMLPGPYSRLPTVAQNVVDQNTWTLSRTAVGMSVDFKINVTTTSPSRASVFVRYNFSKSAEGGDFLWPINGHSGIDLYVRDPNLTNGSTGWRWAMSSGNGCQKMSDTFSAHGKSYAACLTGMPDGSRDVRVYLPARGLLETVEIGVLPGTTATPISSSSLKPVVWYGTSIVHGAAALHAGMYWTNQANRMLQNDRPGINMGFSGDGLMQPAVGQFLKQIDAAAFVLDCEVSGLQVQQLIQIHTFNVSFLLLASL
jgi:hypothetical protein